MDETAERIEWIVSLGLVGIRWLADSTGVMMVRLSRNPADGKRIEGEEKPTVRIAYA
jgi:hypothetical protein